MADAIQVQTNLLLIIVIIYNFDLENEGQEFNIFNGIN